MVWSGDAVPTGDGVVESKDGMAVIGERYEDDSEIRMR